MGPEGQHQICGGFVMKIFIWRHSKLYSSWSMFDEPHVYRDNYLSAEIAVMAESIDQALELVRADDETWNIEELKRIEPTVIPVDQPAVIGKNIAFV